VLFAAGQLERVHRPAHVVDCDGDRVAADTLVQVLVSFELVLD
jgi:hypothetical protein